MNIFKEVKGRVTARQAAEFYGMQVNHKGMARCPFHDDNTPSMKLDTRFHCFGCQADGDVIDLAAKLFNLSVYDAAEKLVNDFCLVLPEEEQSCSGKYEEKKTRETEETEEQKKERRILRLEEKINAWLKYAEETLILYFRLLEEWENNLAPTEPGAELHPLFVESMQRKSIIEHQLDLLQYGSEDDRLDFSRRRERG